MISDLVTAEAPPRLEADVCIVGAGPAGITLALELARKGRRVVLLESGGDGYEESTQALYAGKVTGHNHIDVADSRLRQFGGTSGHWTGLCAPLDALDFEPRVGAPEHRWPISRADLDPFYARAQSYLDLGPYRYDWDDWKGRLTQPALPFDPQKLTTSVFQQSPPTRFAEKFMGTVRAEPKIDCWLHANLTDIALDPASGRVTSVSARTLHGQSTTITANCYVIACGGIENARILLNCRAQRSQGIGNENGLVGRYYTDHMTIETSTIIFNEGVDTSLYRDTIENDGAALQMALKVDPAVRAALELNNNAAFLAPHVNFDIYRDDFRDYGWVGFSEMLKSFSRGHAPDRFAERSCDVIDDLPNVATGLYRHALRAIGPAAPTVTAFRLRQDAEQSPNPDSRVTLTDDVDPLGFQRVALDWKVTSDDLLRLRRTHQYIGEQIGAAGLGRMQLGISDPPDLNIAFSGYHHMGTTRMHDDPKQGVVDGDCRLHSVGNLYMAGSSTFTTGGCANPTLTITALAIRLADRLAAMSA